MTVMCDVMEILHRRDVGPTHNDVAEVMMNGLRTIIQTIISIDRDDPFVGHLVSVMLAIFRQMTPHHYRNYLGHFATRSDLLDFLIEILMVFKVATFFFFFFFFLLHCGVIIVFTKLKKLNNFDG